MNGLFDRLIITTKCVNLTYDGKEQLCVFKWTYSYVTDLVLNIKEWEE